MIALLFSSMSALAAPPAPPAGHDPEAMKARIEGALQAANASDSQRQSVREILSEQLPYLAQLREEAQGLREDLRAVFLAEHIDRDAAMALRVQMVELFDRSTEQGLGLMLDLAEIFTPEQRAVLAEMRRERMRERFAAPSR